MESNNIKLWYEESFGEDYLSIYSHRNDTDAQEDVRAIIKLTGARKDWGILDLCCGTGRHLRAFHRSGYRNLFGLDLSRHLLTQGYARDIKFVQGDMRNIPFKRDFHLVLSLFTSFGYFFSDRENLKVLEEVISCLRPGGRFLLDYINHSYIETNLIPEDITYSDGKKISSRRWISSDGLRVEKEVRVIEEFDKKIYYESVRLFTLSELIDLMLKAGFININYYCGLTCKSLTDKSSRVTLIGNKGREMKSEKK
ncbi:MAG TPA: methyltransferase domain-containing protein [Candidatus Eremiobacteraeota bacterium]|nr:methyltransferase domain-containing protein [Candidatus Eremiobacteraeota bacterium]